MGSTDISKNGFESTKLTDKQRHFCREYVVDYNGTRAAREAGYKIPNVQATKLLKKVLVQAYIRKLELEIARRLDLRAEEVRRELYYLATRSAKDFCDDNGKIVTNVAELNPRAQACIDGIKQRVRTYVDESGETVETIETELKLSPKLGAVELALKYKGMFDPSREKEGDEVPRLTNEDWSRMYEPPEDYEDTIEARIVDVENKALPSPSKESNNGNGKKKGGS